MNCSVVVNILQGTSHLLSISSTFSVNSYEVGHAILAFTPVHRYWPFLAADHTEPASYAPSAPPALQSAFRQHSHSGRHALDWPQLCV